MTKILGIETTCDETGAAVVNSDRTVHSNVLASQVSLHEKYGGIVPELASREHFENLPFIVDEALKQANTKPHELDAIAIAKEPGLPPALSVGYSYASGLALSLNLPLIEVNHLEAHISAIWISPTHINLKEIPHPLLCLLVSGGHTELRLLSNSNNIKVIGRTRDDAAGEAFDKVARILGLSGYPGGPIIQKMASGGDEAAFNFPRPMIDSSDFDFSFSGLKTAVLREVEKYKGRDDVSAEVSNELKDFWVKDMAASFQEAVVEVLVDKTIKAADELGIEHIALAGGVSANQRLREVLGRACQENEFTLYYPDLEYCNDNAAMIAARGCELIGKE